MLGPVHGREHKQPYPRTLGRRREVTAAETCGHARVELEAPHPPPSTGRGHTVLYLAGQVIPPPQSSVRLADESTSEHVSPTPAASPPGAFSGGGDAPAGT